MDMPKVKDCSVSGCAYNTSDSCHAMAITVGASPDNPLCDTFFLADRHGGVMDLTAGVGACKSFNCVHNKDYECTAETVHVGMKAGHPDCLTFSSR